MEYIKITFEKEKKKSTPLKRSGNNNDNNKNWMDQYTDYYNTGVTIDLFNNNVEIFTVCLCLIFFFFFRLV